MTRRAVVPTNPERVTVMGLGRFGGGAGAARYFARRGAKVVVTDAAGMDKLAASVASLDGLGVEFVLGEHRERDFAGADLVVANQAVRPENRFLALAREAGVPITTETGLALSLNRSPWLAVTGSSGKSTTSALAAAMLAAHNPDTMFGGNIGGDLLTRIEGHPPTAPLVVELSSFQLTYILGDIDSGLVRPPDVVVLTNLSPNHLDWHSSLDEYYETKKGLARRQTAGGWAILNVSDPELLRLAEEGAAARIVACSLEDSGRNDACYADSDRIVVRLDGSEAASAPLSALRLFGRHNRLNAVQAVAAAYAMCGDAKAIAAGLASFGGLPHRLETVAEANRRRFVNDSKCTTPEAARLALEAVPGPKTVIAGGYDKKSSFDAFGAALQRNALGVTLVGEAAARIKTAIASASALRPPDLPPLAVVECGGDFALAVREAYRLCPPGGSVLLSPACASWGLFTNYEERGETFKRIARELSAEA